LKSITYVWVIPLALACCSNSTGQEVLKMPSDQIAREAVVEASKWLTGHVKRGSLQCNGEQINVSVIAWKDPTLAPEAPDHLAGYAITDTLWASYALTLTQPDVAKELQESLRLIDCQGNHLHEVIWQPVDSIHHKPIDADIVHGRSVGKFVAGIETIDVRSFSLANDPDFSIGHPTLFVEHAVYQALFEYREGSHDLAKHRLRKIFRKESDGSKSEIWWDAKHQLLVDFVVAPQHAKLVSGEETTCRQYSFKLATLVYASRLMGIDRELPDEVANLRRILSTVQFGDGGIPHFYDVRIDPVVFTACPDATGEATAIFMLAETIRPDKELVPQLTR